MYADTGVHGAPPSKRFVAGITFSTCVRASKMTRTKKRYPPRRWVEIAPPRFNRLRKLAVRYWKTHR